MSKIRNIFANLILEAQRYKFSDEVRDKMKSVTEKLWSDRKKPYKGKELVDVILFKLADGTEGLARIVVNPRLPYMGQMGTKPQKSVDPADIVIEVNPKHYESKKTLYLTLYHEMIHASDPTQSHLFSPKYMSTYNEKSDKDYWGHPIEFFAISNEFLEGLVLEFERRIKRNKKTENLQFLEKSLKNIMNYFAKGDPLSKLSKDILFRINDEHLGSDLVRVFKNLTADNPQLADFMSDRQGEEPYYIYYVELIKKYNPEIWKKFLSMLYQTGFEIRDLIHKNEI